MITLVGTQDQSEFPKIITYDPEFSHIFKENTGQVGGGSILKGFALPGTQGNSGRKIRREDVG